MWMEVLVLILTLVGFIIWKFKKIGGYWTENGVAHLKMGSFGGSVGMKKLILKRKHVLEVFSDHYHMFPDEKIYGIFSVMKPSLVVKDPEIVRHIFVKDFNSFTDRESEIKSFGEKRTADSYWKHQLTSLNGDKWKDVRSTFSPVFTSGKMKMMLKFIQEISEKLVKEFEIAASDNVDVELKEEFGKFSMDAIASCAFGVDAESFENKNSLFVQNAANIFRFSLIDGLRIMAVHLIPGFDKVYEAFNINVMHPKETSFFVDVIRKTIKHRRESNIRRNDLIDLMLDAMSEDSNNDNGEIENLDQYEKDMKMDHVSGIKDFDEKTIVSTAMVLMAAGYDTTAMTLAFAAYEITKKPEIQTRLQKEIDEVYAEADGRFPDFNAIQNLPYLDQVRDRPVVLQQVPGYLLVVGRDVARIFW